MNPNDMYLPNFQTMSDPEILDWITTKVTNKEKENIVCDYKEQIVLSDSGKGEVCKDICGFANEIGGCVLIGIAEERDVNNRLTGKPKSEIGIVKQEGLVLALENILRSGISPTLPAIHIREICVDAEKNLFVYLIHHPKSWLRPHMVTHNKTMRYYVRAEESTQHLQEHQISYLYEERNSGRINALEYFKKLDFGNYILDSGSVYLKIGVLPMPFRESSFDPTSSHAREFLNTRFDIGNSSAPWLPNKDGAIAMGGRQDNGKYKYVAKLHHSGAFTFLTNILSAREDRLYTQLIGHYGFEETVEKFLIRYLNWINHDIELFYLLDFQSTGKFPVTSQTNFFQPGLEPIPDLISSKEFTIGFITSSKQILNESENFKNIILDRLANLVGLWHSPKSHG